ncbi:hypothetical protein GF339_21260 [candidate division KSB3 bacterium]|uniref:Uncharacterized protein n=1 Tax=candidate division KSB3 bacterium TaxID=2044937 RepID=A0A9D5JZQ8_9BACT|nr:hypothetical protein [candidate division KSB3 bacterium]MBD3327130.1 hypothetical protein [candidate division KSB3 bacterium]
MSLLMREFLLILLIVATGIGVMRMFGGSAFPVFTSASAFPLGVSVWVGCYLLIYVLPFPLEAALPFDVHLTFVLYCLVAAVMIGLGVYRHRLTAKEVLTYGIATGLLGFLSIITTHLPVVAALGVDSFFFLDITQGLDTSLQRGWAIFNQCVQALSLLIHYDYVLTTVPALSAASLVALMAYLVFSEVAPLLPRSRLGISYVICLSFLPAFLMFSPFLGLYMLVFFKNQVLPATLLFLFVGSWWFATRKERPVILYAGSMALMAFTLTRMEGLLFAIVLWLILVSDPDIYPIQQRKISLIMLCIMLPWHLYVVWTLWGGTTKFSAIHFLIITGAFMTVMLGFQLNRWETGRQILRSLVYLIPLIGFEGLMICIWLKPDHMLTTIHHFLMNLLIDHYGGWGSLWYFVVISGTVVGVYRIKKLYRGTLGRLGSAWLSTLWLLLGIIFFRDPIRLGFGDSANRMLFHVLPLLLVWLVIQIGQLRSKQPRRTGVCGS